MTAWLRDTAGIYGRALGTGVRLLVATPVLVVPAFACLIVPTGVALLLAPLGGAGPVGAVLRGVVLVLVESACWSALLACTGEVIRTRRLVLSDVRSGFVAHLGDIVNVRFVLWILTFASAVLGGPFSVMILLAALTFFNAVPELIYLGRHGTADLLAASYRFIGERWIEWFPLNVALLALLLGIVAATDLAGLGVGAVDVAGGGFLRDGLATLLGLAATSAALAFAMLVRGVLFLELTGPGPRSRAFRQAVGS